MLPMRVCKKHMCLLHHHSPALSFPAVVCNVRSMWCQHNFEKANLPQFCQNWSLVNFWYFSMFPICEFAINTCAYYITAVPPSLPPIVVCNVRFEVGKVHGVETSLILPSIEARCQTRMDFQLSIPPILLPQIEVCQLSVIPSGRHSARVRVAFLRSWRAEVQ